MAVTSLVNLVASPFTNPATASPPGAQNLPAPAQTQPAQTAGNDANTNAAEPQDQFVASNQNPLAQSSAEAAGLFTVTLAATFTPAADTLLAQANPPPINAANTPANTEADNATAAVGAAALPQPATAAAPDANVTATNAVVAAAANTTAANATGANATVTAAGAATGTANVETQLRTLNYALQALGLNPTDITQIDQIASLIDDYNPNTFTNLAYQLVAQSQEAAKQTAATAANATPTTAAVDGAQGAPHA